MGFNCLKARATMRRQFTFYHSVPRNSWYSFNRPRKDERLSQTWSHRVVLNKGPLYWESSALTTRPLLNPRPFFENWVGGLTPQRNGGSPQCTLCRAWIEYCNMIHKNSKRYRRGIPPDRLQFWENMKNSLDALKINFQRFSALSFLHLISNGLNGVNMNSLKLIVALL